MAHQAVHRCSHCGHAGSDILVKSCQNGCAYHARCIDLVSIARRLPTPALSAGLAPAAANQGGELHKLTQCPCCAGPAAGLEMIPLSLGEIDQARRLGGCKDASTVASKLTSQPGKRSALDMDAAQEANFYDPEHPRTGKWSDEEIAFRDALVPHFVDGNLPLLNGLKLIDFLSAMLKSKPSRLTKKMKHAKLSTRHFHLESGHIHTAARAQELGNLEAEFVNSISDAVERSEIKFHMQREWRDHLAERLTLLRISFDAEAWLKSVDAMDRRITLAKSRNRAVKRRLMMGKAFEKDTSSPTPGIFINNDAGEEGDVDFELLANALAKDDAEDDDLKALFTSLAGESGTTADAGGASQGVAAHEVSVDDSGRSATTTLARGASSGRGATSPGSAEPSMPPPPFRSALLPSLGSSDGPNFRSAAPFLAKITGYIERNQYPFEHIDVWVPSASDPMLDPTGATAPEPSLLGSGSTTGQGGRLCFAGSASVGVQIMPDEAPADLISDSPSGLPQVPSFGYQNRKPSVPLTSDEMYHLSLFGSYSSKFSFSSGSGLPGRVFQSNIPAWEQFVSNAPSELFERRGGAMQFGIKTALGLPVHSPNVGRIVVVLYSRHDRVKDDALVGQICRDFGSLGPCPRWKLMVDMGTGAALSAGAGVAIEQAQLANSESQTSLQGPGLSEKNVQVSNLIALLGENMPSDASTSLGMQLNNIMTLRMVLLKTQRTPEEEHLVDSTITLFDSYVQAGRSRPDITLMLARDFAFHSQIAQQQQAMPSQAHMQRQGSLPHMANLSIGSALGQHQVSSGQLDHLDHSLDHSDRSAPIQIQAQQLAPLEQDRRSVSLGSTPDGYAVGYAAGGGDISLSSVTERNYSSPPKSALTEMLEGKRVSMPTSEPPASLHS